MPRRIPICHHSLYIYTRLRPWHLKRLKLKFDSIDIDGSGNIDADEFFEAVGEQRTPFTDKLFAMIGEYYLNLIIMSVTLLPILRFGRLWHHRV
jgi:hypothetical protein